jgi:hypothetical protein
MALLPPIRQRRAQLKMNVELISQANEAKFFDCAMNVQRGL